MTTLFGQFTSEAERYNQLKQDYAGHDEFWKKGLSRLFQEEAEFNKKQAEISRGIWLLRIPRTTFNEFVRNPLDRTRSVQQAENCLRDLETLRPLVEGDAELLNVQLRNNVDVEALREQIDQDSQVNILKDAFDLISVKLQRIGLSAYEKYYSEGEDFVVSNASITIASGTPMTVKATDREHDKVRLSRVIRGELDIRGHSKDSYRHYMKPIGL